MSHKIRARRCLITFGRYSSRYGSTIAMRVSFVPCTLAHSEAMAVRPFSLDYGDRGAFLNVLDKICRPMRWLYYACYVMTNQNHLLIETLDNTLSRSMRQVD